MPERKKQDFSGQPKTKDTYTGDWVFHDGAWMTKRQRKKALYDTRERREARIGAGSPPAPPVAAAGGGIATAPILGTGSPLLLGSGDKGTEAPGMNLKNPPIPGAPAPDTAIPSWWINQAIVNPTDPNAQFANMANALLPTLSPEDQRTLATYLATNYKDVYGNYGNVNFGPAPTEINEDIRRKFLSPQRAQLALSLLDRMKTASGSPNMGAGYDFLRNAVNLINQFAVGGALTRERYGQFTNALQGLTGQAGRDLSSVANLAQLFNMPSFSAGPLVSNAPNTRLFG